MYNKVVIQTTQMVHSVVHLRTPWQNKVKRGIFYGNKHKQTINQKNHFPAGSSNPVSDDTAECGNANAGGGSFSNFIVVNDRNCKSIFLQTVDCHGSYPLRSSDGHYAVDP